ncbi:hypothetical protein C0580_03280 [Candidatus Parcubacteria bacterium]|nr:MAG: hypothetical protein C0580_03280 [Candidatus Parcubacteria bacterium]
MKNKKVFAVLILSIFISSLSFVFAPHTKAASQMYFEPNVEIPLLEDFLGDKQDIEGKCLEKDADGNCVVQAQGYVISGDTIGQYIAAIYSYAARFVAILAMFMFVIAGWQWLFAAGNAEKVNNAKQTINGVLIGMILLLGGQLLLSQISVRLVSFDTLDIQDVSHENQASGCQYYNSEGPCEDHRDENGYRICRWTGSVTRTCEPLETPELYKCQLSQAEKSNLESSGANGEIVCCELNRSGESGIAYAYANLGSGQDCDDLCPERGRYYGWTNQYAHPERCVESLGY